MKILVIQASGFHLGYLGCYGNDWIDTANLDFLASQGVVFDQHFADCLDRWPTAATGVYYFDWLQNTPPKSDSLEKILGSSGISLTTVEFSNLVRNEEVEEKLQSIVQAIQAEESSLTWLDISVFHPPWTVDEEILQSHFPEEEEEPEDEPLTPFLDPQPGLMSSDDLSQLQRLQFSYAAVTVSVDTFVGRVLDVLSEADLLEDLMIVVTSDRGIALGEHGLVGDYKPWMHEELVHLPLIIRLPQSAEAGRRVPALTQPVDVFSTLLQAFDLPVPNCHGKPLFSLMSGEAVTVRDYVVAGFRLGNAKEWMIRTSDWAFLVPEDDLEDSRNNQLYEKPNDRWEVNDVRQQELEVVEQWEKFLADYQAALQTNDGFSLPELPPTEE